MYVHRTVLCVTAYVSTYGNMTGLLDSLRSKLNLQILCRWRRIRSVQFQDFTLVNALMTRTRQKGRTRARMTKTKIRTRRTRKGGAEIVDQEWSVPDCGYCEKWGPKRVDYRKYTVESKSKDVSAAVFVLNDDENQVVMQIDDEGESLDSCFNVTSLCAAVGSTGQRECRKLMYFEVYEFDLDHSASQSPQAQG